MVISRMRMLTAGSVFLCDVSEKFLIRAFTLCILLIGGLFGLMARAAADEPNGTQVLPPPRSILPDTRTLPSTPYQRPGSIETILPESRIPPPTPYPGPGPIDPSLLRPNPYDVWQIYDHSRNGPMRLVVVNSPYGDHYLYKGVPYPWFLSNQRWQRITLSNTANFQGALQAPPPPMPSAPLQPPPQPVREFMPYVED